MPEDDKDKNEQNDFKAQLEAIKADNDRMKAELEAFKSKRSGDDPDLLQKAELDRKSEDDKKTTVRRQESAVRFNLTVENFAKDNKGVLPPEVSDLIKQADKENFDTASEKAAAIKVGLIQSFFKIQENYDRLTNSQRSAIDRFMNLTKNGRQEEAESIYENVFEPALELVKAHKKAEEVGKARSGETTSTSSEIEYKNRLMEHSRKAFMGDRK